MWKNHRSDVASVDDDVVVTGHYTHEIVDPGTNGWHSCNT